MIPTDRRLRISADLERVVEVRRLVREVALEYGAPPTCLDDLVQAVDEATTNIIVHGYRGKPGWIEVDVAQDRDRIVITLEDEAPTVDPTQVPEPDLTVRPEHRRPGGMGVHLMRLGTDELRHSPRPGGGNILTLARRLDPRPKEDR